MGAYLSGHPTPYVTLVDTDDAVKGCGAVVRIILNATASGGIPTDVLERRGASVLALVAALEAAGKRVAVDVVSANGGRSRGQNHLGVWSVTVKRPEDRLSLHSIAFAVAHPSFLRRFVFAAMERMPEDRRKSFKVGTTYGSVIELPEDRRGNALYFGGALLGDRQWRSDELAAQWVRDEARRQGVTIK